MKFITSNSFHEHSSSEKFVYVQLSEINSDIIEKLRQDKTDKDEKLRIREAQKTAVDSLSNFNTDTLNDFDKNNLFKNKEKVVESTKKLFKNRILKVLNTTPPNLEYKDLIKDLDNKSAEAILTVENVDRALTTLRTLKTGYEEKTFAVKSTKNTDDQLTSRWNWARLQKRSQKENTSERYVFEVRNEVVLNIFAELDKQLAEKETSIKDQLQKNAQTIRERFDEMEPSNKKAFLKKVKNVFNGATMIHLSDEEKYVLGSLSFLQQKEAFKVLGWDQSDIKQVLKDSKKEMNFIQDAENSRRKALESFKDKNKIESLQKSLLTGNVEPGTPSDDLDGLLDDLRPFVENYGNKNRKTIFKNYPQTLKLNPHEEFIAYCQFLSAPTQKNLVETIMKKELKQRFLDYLTWVHKQEKPERETGFSQEFIDTEKELETIFETSKTTIDEFRSYSKIEDIKPTTSTTIGNLRAEITQKRSAFSLLTELSKEEKNILEQLLNTLERVAEELKKLDQIWKKEKQETEDYTKKNKFLSTLKTLRKKEYGKIQKLRDGSFASTSEQIIVEEKIQASIENLEKTEKDLADLKAPTFTLVAGNFSENYKDIELKLKEITTRGAKTKNDFKSDRFFEYFREESAKTNNSELEKTLQKQQIKYIDYLLAMELGSSVKVTYQTYEHGNPPTSNAFLDKSNDKNLDDLTLLEKTENGSV